MFITAAQIRAARALIGVSQDGLARLSGISRPTLSAIEGGSDTKASILKSITGALESRGILFSSNGVSIAERMTWRDPAPDAATRRRIVSGLNDARRSAHRPPLVDDLED
jgi:transcriptional regulator with XRE-family HTH domain